MTEVAETTYADRMSELRGPDFVPDNRFSEIRMSEVPTRNPYAGEMILGYVFDAVPEEFVNTKDEKRTVTISDRMPIAGPIFYEIMISPGTLDHHQARCAGCTERSEWFPDRSGDKEIFRWARKHRCATRNELGRTFR